MHWEGSASAACAEGLLLEDMARCEAYFYGELSKLSLITLFEGFNERIDSCKPKSSNAKKNTTFLWTNIKDLGQGPTLKAVLF